MEPIEALREHGSDGPRLRRWEAHLLSVLRAGDNATSAFLGVLISGALTVVIAVLGLVQGVDAAALHYRGQEADAIVEQVSKSRGSQTTVVVFVTGPVGRETTLPDTARQRAVSERVHVRYDPGKLTRVRDAELSTLESEDLIPALVTPVFAWVSSIYYRWWRWVAGRRSKRHRVSRW